MVKILHTADLHLGSTFYALDEERAKIRKHELLSVFDNIVETVKSEGVQYLLIAGDLFDNSGCIKDAEYVNAKLGEIPDVKVFICAGNHDPKNFLYDKIHWSDNVHIFSGELECIESEDCNIYGASFLNEYQKTALLADVEKCEKTSILVMHGDFSDGAYNLIDKEMLKNFDYAALGHIHKYSGIHKHGESAYAYCGTPAGHGFDEEGENGFIIGDVDKGSVHLEYRKTTAREYHTLKYNVSSFESNADLVEKIESDINNDNLYCIVLVGECGFAVSEEYIKCALEKNCFYVKIKNCSGEIIDYSELVNEYTFTGVFVGKMLDKINSAESPEEKAEYERALRCGMAAINGRGELFD